MATRVQRAHVAIALTLSFAGALAQAPAGDPPAQPAPLAARSLLLDLAHAGSRLVTVGDRGHVLYSDDSGVTWTQAMHVPTSAMLTGVHFADVRRGWAVGHDEIVLRTEDGGNTWSKVHDAPQAQRPLLDVWFADHERGIAIGAYGAYYVSTDGGATWTPAPFEPLPLDAIAPGNDERSLDQEAIDEAIGGEFHLNRLGGAGERLYIAAEAGRLFRSDDGGTSWRTLPSPYRGSFFGVLPLDGTSVLAFGLRGNLFRSEDAGLTWRAIRTGTVAMLTDGVRVDERTVVIVGLSGVVLVSRDGARSFELEQQADRKGLSAVAAVDGALVLVGEAGAQRLRLE